MLQQGLATLSHQPWRDAADEGGQLGPGAGLDTERRGRLDVTCGLGQGGRVQVQAQPFFRGQGAPCFMP